MEIISLKKYKNSSYEVILNDERKIYLHIDIISDYGLYAGKTFSDEELADIIYASNRRKAYQYSLHLLDYRDYSYIEMFNKLMDIYKKEELCFEVMDKLVKTGMINDMRYAENLARKYIEVRKFGIRRAEQEMYKKGITHKVAGKVLENYSDYTEKNLSELLERKYFRFLQDSDDKKNIQKVKASLVRMGYNFDDINEAVKIYFEKRKDF